MAEWKSVAKCSEPCETCQWSSVEHVGRLTHLLCSHPEVIASYFNRPRIAASVVRADICKGARWKQKVVR